MTPFEKVRLRSAAFDEMLRIIREEDPPAPSTRLSTTNELPAIAANRGLEPQKLSGLMRGELDWIVMKCLEKDRNRRLSRRPTDYLRISSAISPINPCRRVRRRPSTRFASS